jgi:LPPG:FO 2-phospho-L-lactate transferase
MKVVELSGGVGGARMARGFDQVRNCEFTVIVNVGDDERIHGLHISPDIDTVIYTLAGVEGPEGWGRAEDSFNLNNELPRFGVDNTFLLGDRDLALNLFRTSSLSAGESLSAITSTIAKGFGVTADVIPATDNSLRTEIEVDGDEWLSFQEYFVLRRNQDTVTAVRFVGADLARPAPRVVAGIEDADLVVIGPSNPPLSIWPILAIDGVRSALSDHPNVVAVSPLFGGKTLKGPADRVMKSLGLSAGNAGVVEVYEGLIDTLVIDTQDADDVSQLSTVRTSVTDTRIKDPVAAGRLAEELMHIEP